MSERVRLLLIMTAAVCGAAAIVFAIVRPVTERDVLPGDATSLGRRLAAHPTDWRAATALTAQSLDARVPHELELWRASRTLAIELAPGRSEPHDAFARSGFFHWPELTEDERRELLADLAPQLRDSGTFIRMAEPLFTLTGDLSVLRKNNPQTVQSTEVLRNIAVVNGRFADYRALRQELAARRISDFDARVGALDAEEIINALPPPPYHSDIQPLLLTALAALQRRPLIEDPRRPQVVDALIDYAVRHDLQPLEGLEAITRFRGSASEATRARLARKLGLTTRAEQIELVTDHDPKVDPNAWSPLCGANVCNAASREIDAAGQKVELTIEPAQSDDVPPYVEVYADDALVAEGEVAAKHPFSFAVTPGRHRLDVVIANPDTRNRGSRRVRIVTTSLRAR